MSKLADLPSYPDLVLGVMLVPEDETVAAIHSAMELGYRAFDTAPLYENEALVGEALRTAPLTREELFVTTKLWNTCHGYDEALAAFDRTHARLGLDQVDLYLIHWPVPIRDRFVDTWRALVRLREEGRVRAIGVSNFLPEHLERIIDATGVVPAVNQVEMHIGFAQADLRETNARLGIVTQAWSPLGHGTVLGDPVLTRIAQHHDKTPAQIALRWLTQRGVMPVVKSRNPGRMAENLAAVAFDLSADDLASLDALEQGRSSFGLDPRTFETIPQAAGLNP